MHFLTLAYGFLLVYGTLFPLTDWHSPTENIIGTLLADGIKPSSLPDIITNILVYIPFGLLLFNITARYQRAPIAMVISIMTGTFLSISLEYLQAYNPHRVASILDVILNVGGTSIGVIFARGFRGEFRFGRWLIKHRKNLILPTTFANLGLLSLGLWALSQLSPLVPSIDISTLRDGLKPIISVLKGKSALNNEHTAVYFFSVLGLGLISDDLVRPGKKRALFFGFVLLVLLFKVPMVSRQLSIEALLGSGTALLFYVFLRVIPSALRLKLAAILIILAVGIDALRVDPKAQAWDLQTFNWIPFRMHITNTLIGFGDILTGLWPFASLCYIAIRTLAYQSNKVGITGGIIIFLSILALEWNQQHIPGRHGDITDAFLAWLAWSIAWFFPALKNTGTSNHFSDTRFIDQVSATKKAPTRAKLFWGIAGLLTLLASTIIVKFSASDEFTEKPLDESILYRLPTPQELPEVMLPHFKFAHPRLPAPSPKDVVRLKIENRKFFRRAKRRADKGQGKFYEIILTEFVDSGSQDLNVLHKRLIALKFKSRGQKQIKPLAIAYDWLYHQWTPDQRTQLRKKLEDGAEYIIDHIRHKQRLSPYNVYLYNSPLQALMAASIALYGDSQRGNDAMNFTFDYWKHRVIPVWRQIMGTNGGWHEGGEYIGIGIGQAIYQLPAMWRKATGEDYFKSESGIKGFLDFLIYRTRPDNTHFRWGDASYFNRRVNDRLALSLEYQNPASYALTGCEKTIKPTSWPWGPLSDPSLCGVNALVTMPLNRYFDGIGLLTARSNWSPDATYVSFKAGDNFWSHSHLDQGAFTIYKGGPLAIDSGFYGPRYGADHHMNYTYQTIAHNLVTITDPKDTVPAPRKGNPRPFANDGGQRRVGSSWGIESAPLDLYEWQRKREIYHTASMANVFMEDDFTVGVADLTPAYTNAYSGKGSFSHRTRRVEKYHRIFGYDRKDDVIVIFDRIRATNPKFTKRWLLHTIEKPIKTQDGFNIMLSPKTQLGHKGGRLVGHVLKPKPADVTLIGGPSFEFYVDGKNYPLNKTTLSRKKNAEPGAWRIEINPSSKNFQDVFLVVLLPTLGNSSPPHQVSLLENANQIGCEIIGPSRITRWWFSHNKEGLSIDSSDHNKLKRVHNIGISEDSN